MQSKMMLKVSSSKTAAKIAVMKRRRTAAEKIAANYAKVRTRFLHGSQQKAAANLGIPVGSTTMKYYPHYKSSGVPKHIFCRISNDWQKLPEELHEAIKEDLLRKNPIIEIHLDRVQYVLDFIHMYRLNLTTGDTVSMRWTDNTNTDFFPYMTNRDSKCKEKLGKCLTATAPTEVPQEQSPPASNTQQPPHQMNGDAAPINNTDRIYGRQPRSPYLPFSILLRLLALEIPAVDMQRLNLSYENFLARTITRQTFVDRIRLLAGDDLLRRIIVTFSPPLPQAHY